MKKIIIISMIAIFVLSSCTTIHERYQGKRILTEPEYYGPDYHYYTYASPFIWPGFMWWDPFWYYGFYSYYYYNPYYRYLYPHYYYGGYYYYPYPTRGGKTYVRKRELKNPSSSSLSSQRKVRKISIQTIRNSNTSLRPTSNTATRTKVSSASSSRSLSGSARTNSSSGSRTRVSSSGSSGTKVKKNN